MNLSPVFLTYEDVIDMLDFQLAHFGGLRGVRDEGLLISAILQPQVTFGGVFLLEDFYEMAAAYLVAIVLNHPFLDGNKRVALMAALVFLEESGISINASDDELVDLVLAVIEKRVDRSGVASFFRAARLPPP